MSSMKSVYLDYAAAAPMIPKAKEAMDIFFDVHAGNPSSLHNEGVIAKCAIEEARRSVAKLVDCRAKDIIFTSGGTEANNLVII